MESGHPDQSIQKRLLYNKFDKKLDTVQQEYLRFLFPDDNPTDTPIPQEELLKDVGELEFINFKYKTALLSSNKDLIRNELEILEQGTPHSK